MAVKKTKNFFFVLRSIHLFLRKQCKGVALLLLHGEQYEWFLNGFSLQEQNHYLAPFSLSHTHTHTHLHAYSIVCTYHAKSLTNKHIPTLSLALSITHTYINYDGMPPPLYLMYLLTHTYSYLSMCYLSIHLSIYLSIFPWNNVHLKIVQSIWSDCVHPKPTQWQLNYAKGYLPNSSTLTP